MQGENRHAENTFADRGASIHGRVRRSHPGGRGWWSNYTLTRRMQCPEWKTRAEQGESCFAQRGSRLFTPRPGNPWASCANRRGHLRATTQHSCGNCLQHPNQRYRCRQKKLQDWICRFRGIARTDSPSERGHIEWATSVSISAVFFLTLLFTHLPPDFWSAVGLFIWLGLAGVFALSVFQLISDDGGAP